MSENDAEYRDGIDRMDHPFSYVAGVVGGSAFIVFAGCMSLLIADEKVLRSTNWWSFFVYRHR